jgi:hypothetical protein
VRIHEGRGFLVRSGVDAPWAGTLGALALEGLSPSPAAAPWMALRQLGELSYLLPGGLRLVWNEAPSWYAGLALDEARGFWEALGALPGLTVHLAEIPEALHLASFRAWLHRAEAPTGADGERWRAGALGFVRRSRKGWSLPGFGLLPNGGPGPLHGEDLAPAFLWGEAVLPLPALASLDPGAVAASLSDHQSSLERGLAHRLGIHAWPAAFPFHRRRAQWRMAFLGGAEFMLAGGNWDEAAALVRAFLEELAALLKAPVHAGACDDPAPGLRLGRQAMGEGLPWRSALPMPPEPAAFSPGFAADPRKPSPLEARAFFPPALEPLLDAPPLARLRVPAPPSAAAVEGLLANLGEPPALLWMPPEVPDPPPYVPENAWAPTGEFPYPADPAAGVQLALFEDLEG